MLGILPAPKAATGDGRNTSSKRVNRTKDPGLSEVFAILKLRVCPPALPRPSKSRAQAKWNHQSDEEMLGKGDVDSVMGQHLRFSVQRRDSLNLSHNQWADKQLPSQAKSSAQR
jgi:hypothetical protein